MIRRSDGRACPTLPSPAHSRRCPLAKGIPMGRIDGLLVIPRCDIPQLRIHTFAKSLHRPGVEFALVAKPLTQQQPIIFRDSQLRAEKRPRVLRRMEVVNHRSNLDALGNARHPQLLFTHDAVLSATAIIGSAIGSHTVVARKNHSFPHDAHLSGMTMVSGVDIGSSSPLHVGQE